MKVFLGLVLLMGVIHNPSLPMYWTLDTLLSTPIFSQSMKRNRFYIILRFFHFNNNQTYHDADEERDRLHKIRPLIDLLKNQCHNVYQPGMNLSVDESLVLYKGRLKFRQYIKINPARFGIKLYELCTSDRITLDFLFYCGKGMFNENDPYENMTSTERIPAVLMKNHTNKGHVLYTNNFYISPNLAKFFVGNKTHLVGTVRSNRVNYPAEIVGEMLEKGKGVFFIHKRKHQ